MDGQWLSIMLLTLYRHIKTAEHHHTGTLAVDGWLVTFDTARRGLGGASPINGQCTSFVLFDVAL